MNAFTVSLFVFAAVASASAGHLLAPAAPLLHAGPYGAPLAAPLAGPLAAPLLHAPLHAPLLAPAPILTAPAVVGHAPVVVGHAPVATSTHIGGPIGAHTISRPVATYATTHSLLGAPLAAPALLARPALAYGAPLGLAPALPYAHAGLLARPALW